MRTLMDYPEEPDAPVIWETEVPSKSVPGLTYRVCKHADGSWSCPCRGRRIHFMCHHVAGGMLLLDGRLPEKYKPKNENSYFTENEHAFMDYMDDRQNHNSLIAWHDPKVQEWLAKASLITLKTIKMDPGITRFELPGITQMVSVHSIDGVVLKLLRMGLIIEKGNKTFPKRNNRPHAMLYINPEVMDVEAEWKATEE